MDIVWGIYRALKEIYSKSCRFFVKNRQDMKKWINKTTTIKNISTMSYF